MIKIKAKKRRIDFILIIVHLVSAGRFKVKKVNQVAMIT